MKFTLLFTSFFIARLLVVWSILQVLSDADVVYFALIWSTRLIGRWQSVAYLLARRRFGINNDFLTYSHDTDWVLTMTYLFARHRLGINNDLLTYLHDTGWALTTITYLHARHRLGIKNHLFTYSHDTDWVLTMNYLLTRTTQIRH